MLSESTERYDRDGKFQAYKQLASLEEYVLVAQDERMIEVYRRRDAAFDRFRDFYAALLEAALHHRRFAMLVAGGVGLASLGLVFVVGSDFFPSVDAGLMKLHFRAPTGTRVEETEQYIKKVETGIRGVIPENENR